MAEIAVPRDLTNIIRQKERELHDINEYRVEKLEVGILEKERTIQDILRRFEALKEDFQYNLTLLEARDTEIFRLEKNNEALLSDVQARCVEDNSLLKRFEGSLVEWEYKM